MGSAHTECRRCPYQPPMISKMRPSAKWTYAPYPVPLASTMATALGGSLRT